MIDREIQRDRIKEPIKENARIDETVIERKRLRD